MCWRCLGWFPLPVNIAPGRCLTRGRQRSFGIRPLDQRNGYLHVDLGRGFQRTAPY